MKPSNTLTGAVRAKIEATYPLALCFTAGDVYRIAAPLRSAYRPVDEAGWKSTCRCSLQRMREEGTVIFHTPGVYYRTVNRSTISQLKAAEAMLSAPRDTETAAMPQREDEPMLDTTRGDTTAFGAAFAQAEAAKLNRSKNLQGKAGYYDGKVIEKSELEAALDKAKPLHVNYPVLTPAILRDYLKRATADRQLSADFTIIPEMAVYILANHPWKKNRDLDKNKLSQYESFMIEQSWNRDGTPIKFNDLRELHNGRHRLTACANSGSAFPSTLRFGVPKESYKTEDTGKPWVAGNVLGVADWKHEKLIPHIVRAVVYYQTEDFLSRDTSASNDLRFTQAKQLGQRKLERVAGMGNAIAKFMRSGKRKPEDRYVNAPQYYAQAYYIAREVDADAADAWFERWATNPSKIQEEAARIMYTAPGQGHDTVCRAVPILAWNLFRTNPRAPVEVIRQALHWTREFPAPVAE